MEKTKRSQSTRMLGLFNRIQRLNEQRHLLAIRTAFISVMPVMIIGAFATVINSMPVPAYQDFMLGTFGENWRLFGSLAFNATTQIVTLMVVFAICANLAEWYNTTKHMHVHAGICGMMGIACYTALSISVDAPDSLPFQMTGVTGLFVAMVVSVLASEIFIHASPNANYNRLLSDDPNPAVPLSFAAVRPAVVVVVIFVAFRVLLVGFGVTDALNDIVYTLLSMPYQNSTDSVATAQLFNVSTHVMWLFGIHGNNVLDEVAQNIFVPAMQQNVAAAAAGLPPPNLVTKTLFDSFVYMGGSGTTLALLFSLLLFGRVRNYRTLFKYALPTSIFNINEPLIFGIPIVLNPIFAIPFVLTPVIIFTTTALSMYAGLVPYTIAEVPWSTPIFFSGYLATGSIAGIFLQAFNLLLGVLIYAPFVRLNERMIQLRFGTAYEELCDIVVKDYTATRKLVSRMDEIGAVARRLANQIDGAVADGEMFLNYQPIVNARDKALHSVEALLRWRHPQHGMIMPMLTVALAEETGRIDRLGLWIMEVAIVQRAEWTKQGIADFHVSVNVSTQQLNDPNFSGKVNALLAKHRVPAGQLQIEITETAALVENEATRRNLANLHDMGVTIAMDDFGVGHSSLLYLRTQPISTLKIDGSLSREVLKYPANLDIISTIHDLCRLLGVDTIIEFVDNQQQLEKLLGTGAFLIQGYLFSPALPGSEIPRFIGYLKNGEHPPDAAAPPQVGAGEDAADTGVEQAGAGATKAPES